VKATNTARVYPYGLDEHVGPLRVLRPAVGQYKVEVEFAAFKTAVVTDIVLNVAEVRVGTRSWSPAR